MCRTLSQNLTGRILVSWKRCDGFADTTGLEEQEREKRRQVMEKFQKAPFEEIAAHCESKVGNQDGEQNLTWNKSCGEPGPKAKHLNSVTQRLCGSDVHPDCSDSLLPSCRPTCSTTAWRRSLSSQSGKSWFRNRNCRIVFSLLKLQLQFQDFYYLVQNVSEYAKRYFSWLKLIKTITGTALCSYQTYWNILKL